MRSVEILEPLLTEKMKAHAAWRSWVMLVALFAKVIKHELEVKEIEEMDDLQLAYVAAFNAVPEYAGLMRPKHHLLTHLARDTWRFGPLRGCWCFGFEGFNKVIKAGAQLSNWKNSTVSVMEYWSMRSACALVRE